MNIQDPKRFIVYNQKDRAGIFCTIEDAICYIDTQKNLEETDGRFDLISERKIQYVNPVTRKNRKEWREKIVGYKFDEINKHFIRYY